MRKSKTNKVAWSVKISEQINEAYKIMPEEEAKILRQEIAHYIQTKTKKYAKN